MPNNTKLNPLARADSALIGILSAGLEALLRKVNPRYHLVLGLSLLCGTAVTRASLGFFLSEETLTANLGLIDALSATLGLVGTSMSGYGFTAATRQSTPTYNPDNKVKPASTPMEVVHPKPQ